ncbi:MAG: glycosyl hydrolase-related protein, partial [Athalassotoga sp.]
AYDFNTPLQYIIENEHDGKFQKAGSFVSVNNGKNVIISAIKKSERSDAIIIRLYEINGQESSIQISSIFPLNEVLETDLLENPITKIKLVSENSFSVDVKKFEIKTLSLKLK